jgi:hypothetical protein
LLFSLPTTDCTVAHNRDFVRVLRASIILASMFASLRQWDNKSCKSAFYFT